MRVILLIVATFVSAFAVAQQSVIKGTILDEATGDPLVGAPVVFADKPGQGSIADYDGNFELKVDPGK